MPTPAPDPVPDRDKASSPAPDAGASKRPRAEVTADVSAWYARHARVLPWRTPGASPWGVLVSEVMLQQTPVSRVLPVWEEWLARWPSPASLAAEPQGEAVRAWGRLGYPRRAQRLHQAARTIVETHRGDVPADPVALRALPGVGDYTAAAVAAFAFGRRTVVLDTNVRRVLARLDAGAEFPADAITAAERSRAETWLPELPTDAARWSVAAMELGAQVCTALAPACGACPVAGDCVWFRAGRPPWDGAPRRGQSYAGTDRQCRGVLLGVLRDAPGAVTEQRLRAAWTADPQQAARALESLLGDGLVHRTGDGLLSL